VKKVLRVTAAGFGGALLIGWLVANRNLINRAVWALVLLAAAGGILAWTRKLGIVWRMTGGFVALLLLMGVLGQSCVGRVGDPVYYVALGDSYSSGEGAGVSSSLDGSTGLTPVYSDRIEFGPGSSTVTVQDRPPCRKSDSAYPRRLADRIGQTTIRFVACTGAVTADVCRPADWPEVDAALQCESGGQSTGIPPNRLESTPQIAHVEQFRDQVPRLDLVTIGIGGNDLRFGELLQTCVSGFDDCVGTPGSLVEATFETQLQRLGPSLESVYASVRRAAGADVPVLAVGYPKVVDERDVTCAPLVGLSVGERAWMNRSIERVNLTIRDSATARGLFYVDVQEALANHPVCAPSGVDFANGVNVLDLQSSFHPTPDGHACIADVILNQYPEPTTLDTLGLGASTPVQPEVGSAAPCS